MKYQLAVFDMDGTILNTLEDLTDSTNYCLKKYGYPERSLEEVRSFVGNGIHLLIERAVPMGTEKENIEEVYTAFLPYYQKHCADKTKPYEGICDLILELRKAGCKTAVVSNKADQAVKELSQTYFAGLFDISVGERTGIAKKPAPDSVNEVLEKMNISREKAVYIGDSEVDVATARNANMDCIAVEWGFRSPDFLKKQGAKVFAEVPSDIKKLIL